MAEDATRRSPDPRTLPARIGRYRVVSRIGKGAMGVVYHAHDELMDRAVAIKVLTADLASDPSIRTRFYREAKAAGQLVHPNIITVFDMGEENGRLFIVMELLQGRTLGDYLRERPHLTLTDKLDIMTQVCSGMAAAHARGIVHRDLKPSNLFVLADGVVKVLDFGVARLADSNVTAAGLIIGTPDYMSPEQARGEPIDHRADIFSAGAVFYYLLTGKRPFAAADLPSLLHKVEHDDPPPIPEAQAPPALAAIVMKALRKDRTQRYQSFNDLLADVLRFHKAYEQQARRTAQAARLAFQQATTHAAALDAEAAVLGLAGDGSEAIASLLARHPLLDDQTTIDPRSVDPDRLPRVLEEVERVRDELAGRAKETVDLVAHYRAAEQALADGDLDRAARELATVLDRVPEAPVPRGLWQRIEAERARAAERAARVKDLLARGHAALEAGDWHAARAACDEVLAIDPASTAATRLREEVNRREEQAAADAAVAEARRLVGWAEEEARAGRPEAALSALREYAARVPEAPGVGATIAAIAAQVAAREEAARRRAAAEAAVADAERAVEDGQLAVALAALEQALASDGTHARALELKAQVQAAQARAAAEARREAELQAHLDRARAHLTDGRLGRARREVARAMALDPTSVAAREVESALIKAEAARRAQRTPVLVALQGLDRRVVWAGAGGVTLLALVLVVLWAWPARVERAPTEPAATTGEGGTAPPRATAPPSSAEAGRSPAGTTPAAPAPATSAAVPPAGSGTAGASLPGAGVPAGETVTPSAEAPAGDAELPRLPQLPGESQADWLARRRRAFDAVERGQAALARGRPAEALAAFEAVAAEHPAYPGIDQRIAAARRALAAANRNLARRLFAEAQQLEGAGDLLGGMEKYRAALRADPELPDLVDRMAILEKLMIARAERLIGEAETEASRDPATAVRRYEEALRYLPERHPRAAEVRQALDRLRTLVG